ncbi:MAG: metal-dependent transcriptional regulator [Bacilli bacterium]|nr:metal-dependent transcriptional regulator [Bacilli bacterium]
MNKIESREDYLEAILEISQEKEFVRCIDIANRLNFSRASVTIAMQKLEEEKLIHIDSKRRLSLTDEGLKIANETLEKHKFLTQMFIKMDINELEAEKMACAIEHSISHDAFEKMKKYSNNH